MPVLPGASPSQVLNPGSPVPVGSSAGARNQGETIQGFGAALSQLGDVLDAAGRSAKNETDKLQLLNAENVYRQQLLKKRAEQGAAAPIQGDISGFGAVESVKAAMDPIAAEIAESIGSPQVRSMFLARSGDIFNDTSTTIWAEEVKKKSELNKTLTDNLISSSGQIARAAPDLNTTSLMLGQVEAAILENDDMPAAVKPLEVARAKKAIITDSVQGMLARKDYAGAMTSLETFGGGVLTPEEKAKQLDEIRNTENQDYNREYTKLIRNERQEEKSRKAGEQRLLNYYSAALQQAGSSDYKRAPIIAELEKMKLANKIDANKADALMGNKVFKDVSDDKVDVEITTRAFKTGDFDAAVNEINNRMGDSISIDRAQQMLVRMRRMSERTKSDPAYKANVARGQALINSMAQPSIKNLNALDKQALASKVAMAGIMYHQRLSAPNAKNPGDIAMGIVKEVFGVDTTIIPGNNDIFAEQSVQGLMKLKDKFTREGLALQQKGQLTPQLKEEKVRQLKAIDLRLQSIQNKENIQEQNSGGRPTESSTTGAVPARGK